MTGRVFVCTTDSHPVVPCGTCVACREKAMMREKMDAPRASGRLYRPDGYDCFKPIGGFPRE